MSESTGGDEPRWSAARRAAFRFGFVYLVLATLPFPLGFVPGFEVPGKAWGFVTRALVRLVGMRILGLHFEIQEQTGSGDTTADYVLVLCFAVFAALATLVWSLLDRRRRAYARLEEWLLVGIRYSVGSALLSYGCFKLIKSQFPFPSPETLLQTYGESSPMRLLWTLMGYSTGYNLFTGAAEAGAGLLLLFRRTTTLGALLGAGVMANVVALNFFYDVPVKLYSSLLFLECVLLASYDARRLLDVLWWHRPAAGRSFAPHFTRTWMRRSGWALKGAFILAALFADGKMALEGHAKWGDGRPHVAVEGMFDVESFTRDGVAIAPYGDAKRWHRLAVSSGRLTAVCLDDTRVKYAATHDDANRTITLSKDDAPKGVLTYARSDADHVTLEGTVDGAKIVVGLKTVDPSRRLLVDRGFHWIAEQPFNR